MGSWISLQPSPPTHSLTPSPNPPRIKLSPLLVRVSHFHANWVSRLNGVGAVPRLSPWLSCWSICIIKCANSLELIIAATLDGLKNYFPGPLLWKLWVAFVGNGASVYFSNYHYIFSVCLQNVPPSSIIIKCGRFLRIFLLYENP